MQKLAVVAALSTLIGAAGCSGRHVRYLEPDASDASSVDGDEEAETDAEAPPDPMAEMVVHEWGVIASNMTHTDPGRVYNTECIKEPILYFYADEPTDVSVRVNFGSGTGGESWPEVLLGEIMEWPHVEVNVEPCEWYTPFPEAGEGQCNHEFYECEATQLERYIVSDASCITVDEVVSPLLFYAGALVDFTKPIGGDFEALGSLGPEIEIPDPGLAPGPGVPVRLSNQIDTPSGPVFLIYRNFSALCIVERCIVRQAIVGMASIESLPVSGASELTIETTQITIDSETGEHPGIPEPEIMAAEFGVALLDAGLTGPEIDALLLAWDDIFFGLQPFNTFSSGPDQVTVPASESLAVISVLPRSYYDSVLPLTIEPEPREMVRVALSYSYLEPDAVP